MFSSSRRAAFRACKISHIQNVIIKLLPRLVSVTQLISGIRALLVNLLWLKLYD